jgi:ankyrin repeat protein
MTALQLACGRGRIAIAKLLIAKGADLNAKDNVLLLTPEVAVLGYIDVIASSS